MTDLTPAAELRQAAALMRERAQAATEGPWKDDGSPSCVVFQPASTRGVAWCSNGHRDEDLANSAHIAGMHPGVALKLAALFDKAADRAEINPFGAGELIGAALETARAYLGTATAGEQR